VLSLVKIKRGTITTNEKDPNNDAQVILVMLRPRTQMRSDIKKKAPATRTWRNTVTVRS